MFDSLKQEVAYFVFGKFTEEELESYFQEADPPDGCQVDFKTEPSEVAESSWPLNEPPSSDLLAASDGAVVARAREATSVAMLVGQRVDPTDAMTFYTEITMILDILALDPSCLAIVDLKTASIYSPESWTARITKPLCDGVFDITSHIIQQAIPQDDGLFWLSTRGMIKFGKPELSIHDLAEEQLAEVNEVLNTLAGTIILENEVPPDGKEVVLGGTPLGCKAAHQGTYEDDDFWRNVHVELVRLPVN